MLSRRRLLAGVGTAGVGALVGCNADSGGDRVNTSTANTTNSTTPAGRRPPATGLVWQKEISVRVPRRDGGVWTDVLQFRFDRDRNRVWGDYDPEYVAPAVEEGSVSVPPSVHDTLDGEFGRVEYVVSLGPVDDGGHLHARARRENFNEIPLAGQTTVETVWEQVDEDRRVGYVRPTDTTPRTESLTAVDVGTFDLGNRFDEY